MNWIIFGFIGEADFFLILKINELKEIHLIYTVKVCTGIEKNTMVRTGGNTKLVNGFSKI